MIIIPFHFLKDISFFLENFLESYAINNNTNTIIMMMIVTMVHMCGVLTPSSTTLRALHIYTFYIVKSYCIRPRV